MLYTPSTFSYCLAHCSTFSLFIVLHMPSVRTFLAFMSRVIYICLLLSCRLFDLSLSPVLRTIQHIPLMSCTLLNLFSRRCLAQDSTFVLSVVLHKMRPLYSPLSCTRFDLFTLRFLAQDSTFLLSVFLHIIQIRFSLSSFHPLRAFRFGRPPFLMILLLSVPFFVLHSPLFSLFSFPVFPCFVPFISF